MKTGSVQSVKKWLLSTIFLSQLVSCATAGNPVPDVIGCIVMESMLVKWRPPMLPVDDPSTPIVRPNPVCMKEIGEAECGYCTYTISEKKLFVGDLPKNQYMSKAGPRTWTQLKKRAILLPAVESYAPLKAAGINSCKNLGAVGPCKDIARWRIKLDSWDSLGTVLTDP